MKLIIISRDPKVLEVGSPVRNRMLEYGKLFDELYVIIYARTHNNNFEEKLLNNIFLYNSRSNNFFFVFIKTLGILFKICKKLKKEKNVWISTHDPFEAGIIGVLGKMIYGFGLQFQIHTDFLDPGFKREKFINKVRVFIAKKILPYADSIRVVSDRIKDSLKTENLKLKTSSIHVLPIFVDVEKIKNQKIAFDLHKKYPEFEKIILIASRLTKEKNLDLALRSFSKILHKLPNAGLVIVGSGSEEVWLKKYATYLKIENNVRFEGWVNDPVSYYKSSDMFLITSLYEGYGMSIVEALASSCPVVSTDVGVAKEIGAVIVNYDPGEIALKAVDVLSTNKKQINIDSINKEEYLIRFKKTFTV